MRALKRRITELEEQVCELETDKKKNARHERQKRARKLKRGEYIWGNAKTVLMEDYLSFLRSNHPDQILYWNPMR